MRRVSMVSTLCILASLLISGPMTTGAPALASTNSPFRVTVQGTFTDAVTGDPVAGACISLYRASVPIGSNRNHRLAKACSDASGAFSLPDLPNFSHYAYLEAPGYGGQWYGGAADFPTAFFNVAPAQGRTIPLKRMSAGLSVHLTRQDGSPAPNASVQLTSSAGTSMASMRTDANGDVNRTDLPAGDYKVRVSGAGYQGQYYPGKALVADGQLVTLVAGSTLSLSEQFLPVDPMPSLPALSPMSGTVRAADGTPIAGAMVTAKAINSPIVYGSTSTGADGTYTMQMPGGSGLITVSAPGYATVWNTDDPLPLTAIVLSGTRDFVLRPGSGTIRGTLTDSVPGPIPAQTSMSVLGSDGWAYSVAYVGYDGTFEIPNMPAGTYTLSFTPPGRPNQQIQNVIVRDGEVTTADARLLDPGRIRVHVVDDVTGEPIAGATVTASSSQYQVKTSDAQGYAEFGDYWQPIAVQVSATHKPYHFALPSVIVQAAPGTPTTEVTLRMQQAAVLSIPVGNVDPMYTICVDLLSPNRTDGWTTPDCELPKNGAVTFGPIQPDTYRAFLRPSNRTVTGAQWVSDSGGTGEERSATVLRLTAGSTSLAPEQRLGAAGSITGTSIDPKTHEVVAGCVQFASLSPAYYDSRNCVDASGVYRIDGLGPYAWPLFFSSGAGMPHGSIWSGGATSRLDAKLVTVPGGGTATYNFAPGDAVWFDVRPPADAQNPWQWGVTAYDPQTGDYVGVETPGWSTIGPGPKLLRFAYSDQNGAGRTCWLQRGANLRDGRPNGVYYGGTLDRQPLISVVPGKNCLARMPSIVRITPAPGNLKPLDPGQPATPRQAMSVAGRSGVAGAPSIAGTQPETFNDLVRNSFDSALQLALGALS